MRNARTDSAVYSKGEAVYGTIALYTASSFGFKIRGRFFCERKWYNICMKYLLVANWKMAPESAREARALFIAVKKAARTARESSRVPAVSVSFFLHRMQKQEKCRSARRMFQR